MRRLTEPDNSFLKCYKHIASYGAKTLDPSVYGAQNSPK